MNLLNTIKLLPILVGLGSALVLGAAPSAHAASIYDDVITLGNASDLKIDFGVNFPQCQTNEIGLQWSEPIFNTEYENVWFAGGGYGTRTSVAESFNTALQNENGSWLVVSYKQTNSTAAPESSGYMVFWNEDEPLELTWYEDSVIPANAQHSVFVTAYDESRGTGQPWTCQTTISYYPWAHSAIGIYNETTQYKWILQNKVNMNYPTGYEGEVVPDTLAPGAQNSDFKPDIKLHHGSNWKVELSDYNFYTFDKELFTCGAEDFAPNISWKIYDITNTEAPPLLIDELMYPANAVVTYTAPKKQEDRKYKLTAIYTECANVTFTETAEKEFTIKADGNLNQADFMTVCITDTFPFINFNGCMALLNSYLSALSFNAMNFNFAGVGQGWNFTESCRQLQVLDDWIQAPNATLCPQVPSTIRNIVTPFITFALALLLITFISRRQAET